jgi:hypothetical protein
MQNITIFINAGWNVTGRASHALCKHVIDRMLVFHFIFKLLKRMPEIASRRPTGIVKLTICFKESIAHWTRDHCTRKEFLFFNPRPIMKWAVELFLKRHILLFCVIIAPKLHLPMRAPRAGELNLRDRRWQVFSGGHGVGWRSGYGLPPMPLKPTVS